MERIADWSMKRRARTSSGGAGKRGEWPFAVAALIGLGAILYFYGFRAWRSAVIDEDAYISFRYARNLLEGHGLVFNPGWQPVEGITNLLWTLCLAAVSWLGADLTSAALVLGVVCGGLTLIVAYHWCRTELTELPISRRAAYVLALAAPLLIALAPGFAFYAGSGLEVAMFALLLVTGLYFLGRAESARFAAAGSFLLGAAAITRPEGALVLAVASGVFVLRCVLERPAGTGLLRRAGVAGAAGILPGALVVGVTTLWRVLYYGSPIPNTASAKAGGLEVMERWGIPYLLDAVQANWIHVVWLLALCGALAHRRLLVHGLAVLLILPLWCAYVVYVGGDYMPFYRLLVPILPAAYVLAVAGIAGICTAIPGFADRVSPAAGAAVMGVPLAGLVFLFASQVPEQLEAEQAREQNVREDVQYWRALGNWFDENRPNAVVARNAVGSFGYHSDVNIVDMLGLNNEYIAQHGTKDPTNLPGHQTGDGPYVLSREPDYIMLSDAEPEFRFVSDRELVNSTNLYEEYDRITVELDNGTEASMLRREEDAS